MKSTALLVSCLPERCSSREILRRARWELLGEETGQQPGGAVQSLLKLLWLVTTSTSPRKSGIPRLDRSVNRIS